MKLRKTAVVCDQMQHPAHCVRALFLCEKSAINSAEETAPHRFSSLSGHKVAHSRSRLCASRVVTAGRESAREHK